MVLQTQVGLLLDLKSRSIYAYISMNQSMNTDTTPKTRPVGASTLQATLTRPLTVVAMATFPPRREGMLTVVNKMLPQCDRFYLYLNKYKKIPPGLPDSPKLVVHLGDGSPDHPNLGSHGKLFWCGVDDGYYLTVDDDIHYPDNYVNVLVAKVNQYGRKAFIGGHGSTYMIKDDGAFPEDTAVNSMRTLYGYSKKVIDDLPVHILGTGVMACYPRAIGFTFNYTKNRLNTGDDEDTSLWAQKHQVPMVRISTPKDWIIPNDKVWVINPLHRRSNYQKASSSKLKDWTHWKLLEKPVQIGTVRIPEMITQKPQDERKQKGYEKSFSSAKLSTENRLFCRQILSSDALAALVTDRIHRNIPTSVIRMSDGEGAIIAAAKSGNAAGMAGFLSDAQWLRRYGLEGANLLGVGKRLLWAGEKADFLACTISGVFIPHFKVNHYFPDRSQFIDQFYPELWNATDRVGAILRMGSVLVLHRNYEKFVDGLRSKYEADVTGCRLNSWKDHAGLLKKLTNTTARIILVSGGASGKIFVVQLARATGKVVLDVGDSLKLWAGVT